MTNHGPLRAAGCQRVSGRESAVHPGGSLLHADMRRYDAPRDRARKQPKGDHESCFQCPSETTSTMPSVTLMAVWSSMAYADPRCRRPTAPHRPWCSSGRRPGGGRSRSRRFRGPGRRRGGPLDEVVTDPWRHHHASGAHSHPDRVGQRRQEVGQPGLPHPMTQVGRVATVDQEDVGLADPGHPALRADGGQRRKFEEAQRLPLHRGHATPRRQAGDEASRRDRAAHGVAPLRRRDAECMAFGDGLPSRSTNASRMLAFVTPPEVRRSFKMPPKSSARTVASSACCAGFAMDAFHRSTNASPQIRQAG